MRPDSPAARKVEQDIRIGIDLGISATPQVFVEGKRIPEMFQGKYLIEAVEWLIASKSPENKSTGLRY
jgi:protein-disulfide isomerase